MYGDEPTFWKSVGDEVLFTKILTDHRQLSTTLNCWMNAVRRMKDFLKGESSSLDVKCTVWLAGFPFRNREVVLGTAPGTDQNLIEDYYRESGRLLNTFYSKGNSKDISIDYIGPSIDTGFRLTGFSSGRKMVVIIDVAYILSMTSFDGEIHRIDLQFDGSHVLKGVIGSAPYPIFWINMSGESSLAVKEDKLKSLTTCNKEDIKEFCDAFYVEYSDFTFKPFIKGDVGQTMAKTPSWYEHYQSALVKNFNSSNDPYDAELSDAPTEIGPVTQDSIDSVMDAIGTSTSMHSSTIFAIGERVKHPKFGLGVVDKVDGSRIEIIFDDDRRKRLLSAFVHKIGTEKL